MFWSALAHHRIADSGSAARLCIAALLLTPILWGLSAFFQDVAGGSALPNDPRQSHLARLMALHQQYVLTLAHLVGNNLLICYDGRLSARLMYFYNLIRTEANRAEQGRRAIDPLIQPGLDCHLLLLPGVDPGMQMQHLGIQLPPDLFHRIEPGGIGGQRYQGELTPTQPLHQVGMPMHRPVIVDEKKLLGVRVGLLDLLVETEQGLPVKMRPLPRDESPGVGIQAGGNPTSGVVAVPLVNTGHPTASGRIPLSETVGRR